MNFQEAEYHYRRLRQQLAARQISPQQFAAQVARLRVQDAQGAWWQMRAQDGTWLQWNGRAWLPASLPQDGMRAPMKPVEQPAPPPSQRPSQPPVPPPQGYAMPQPAPAAARPASVPQKPPRKAPKPPKSLAELLLLLLKGYIKRWFIRLPLALAASLLVWVVHTFLLVGPNGGFAPGTNRILDLVLALQGRMVQGTLFWTLLSMLVASSLGRIFRTGPINTIQRVIATPGWVLHSFQQSRLAGAAILLGCGATTVLAGVIQGNLLNNFLLSLLVVGSLIAQRESFPGLVASLAWSDTQRLIKPKKTVPFQLAWVGAGLSGAALGFLWATLLTFSRYAPYCGCASVLLLLGIMVALIVVQKSKPALGATLLLLAVVGATAFSITPALADDGGWEEAGGDIGSWVQSEGAVKAVTMGIPPTLGAGIGVLIGLGLSTLGITLPGIPGLETGGTSIPGSEPPSETPAKQEEPSPEGPPPEGVILDGRQAIDALLQSGRIKPVPQPNGTIRYEPVNLNAGGDLRGICYTSTPDGLLGEGDVVILHEGGPSLRPSVEPQEPAVAPEPPAQPPADVEPVQPLKPEEPVQPPKPEEPVQPPKPEEPVQPPKPEEPVQPPKP
ncbi:MAG: hypothetical protein JW726_09270, partial [Anaerolineales bacterium]|nr:hypothetical protein [Anaerolineales bacterium]